LSQISGAVVILSGDTSDGNKLLSDLFKVEIKSDSSSVLDYSILQIESSSSILLLEPSRKGQQQNISFVLWVSDV
jgi:hypothetical protein